MKDTVHISNTKENSKQSQPQQQIVDLMREETFKTFVVNENESNQQPQDNKSNDKDLFGDEVDQTVYFPKNQNQQTQNFDNNKYEFGGGIGDTLPISLANPDNKENPFEGNFNDIIEN